jgi:hypothetical protein
VRLVKHLPDRLFAESTGGEFPGKSRRRERFLRLQPSESPICFRLIPFWSDRLHHILFYAAALHLNSGHPSASQLSLLASLDNAFGKPFFVQPAPLRRRLQSRIGV